jgi:hypothetical protein
MDTTPVVSLEGSLLTVAYDESGDPCDCMCTHALGYDMGPLNAGTWTIRTVTGDQDVTLP